MPNAPAKSSARGPPRQWGRASQASGPFWAGHLALLLSKQWHTAVRRGTGQFCQLELGGTNAFPAGRKVRPALNVRLTNPQRESIMTRKTSLPLLCIVGLIGLLLMPGYASAQATETEVKGRMVGFVMGDPAKPAWTDEDGITHFRGVPSWGDVTGDLEGDAYSEFNLDVNMETGDGWGAGTVILNVSWGELSGTFEGRYMIKFTGWLVTGSGVAHGTGDFEGMKDIYTLWGDFLSPDRDWEGIILDPHGE